ncbi:MAG: hypothetical protein AUI47_05770 [Acidobacteria bacterium 13_1_40CM_2_68_5]|nr:MAG: hypothetical protein AUI47_05770 [Acidobacteria bacterium 13_1_40CM_2_68_5]
MVGPGRPRVAIIGGGPGGAQCAQRLADAGCPVTVFEPRTRFEKACGGGVPARGMERFPFLHDARLPGKEIRRCLVISPSGREARFPLDDPLFVFGRADLHVLMLDRALTSGARLVRERVVEFRRVGGGRDPGAGGEVWILRAVAPGRAGPRCVAAPGEDSGAGTETGPFDFLVAADGAAGGARRRLVAGAPRGDVSQGLGYYVPQVSEDFITLKFYDGLHGYLWVFPRPDHSSAGICATLGALPAAELRRLMDDFLRGRYPREALDRSERYAALIPGAPSDPRAAPVQGEGWALLGDAARFVDPLTREGIYYAMLSGDLLADALLRRRPEEYSQAWTRVCAPELSWAAGHGGRFFDTRFIERLVSLCAGSPAVSRVLSDLIAGKQSYRTLKSRLLLAAPRVGMQLVSRALRQLGRGDARKGAPIRPARDS